MVYQQRADEIMRILRKNKVVSLKHLIQELNIPPATLRRDLTRMEEENLLERFHGGAKLVSQSYEYDFYKGQDFDNIEEKNMIAKRAVELIKSNDTIFLDSGTTTYTMIQYMNDTSVTVITNSLAHAEELSRKGFHTCIVGGFIQNNVGAIFGRRAIQIVKSFKYDKCFLATTAIDEDLGFLTVYDEDADLKMTVISNSKESYIVADHSKLISSAFIPFAKFNEVTVITNKEIAWNDLDLNVIITK